MLFEKHMLLLHMCFDNTYIMTKCIEIQWYNIFDQLLRMMVSG